MINNSQKVSVNLLNDRKIKTVEMDGKRIVVIEVPRAERTDKPIFLGENPFKGTFRRNGEGDYHCTEEEIQAMYRDKAIKTQDMIVLEKMSLSVFCMDTIRSYRNIMKISRPEHIWTDLEDEDFLYRIGAVAYGEDKKLHPTAAGLLMFGYEFEIIKECPHYFLDYQEQFDVSTRWDDRFVSSSGDWSGNVYDFFRKAYNKLSQNLRVPFQVIDGLRVEDTPVHKAIREALANSLIHADYYGRQGIIIKYKPQEIRMENPGRFRIDLALALEGVITDPRNALLMKFFNLIDVGERSGRGVFEIYRVWESMGWNLPEWQESIDSDRSCLVLPIHQEIYSGDDKQVTTKSDDKKVTIKSDDNTITKTQRQKEIILVYIHEHGRITTAEAADLLRVGVSRAKSLMHQLVASKEIQAQGDNKNRSYIKREM